MSKHILSKSRKGATRVGKKNSLSITLQSLKLCYNTTTCKKRRSNCISKLDVNKYLNFSLKKKTKNQSDLYKFLHYVHWHLKIWYLLLATRSWIWDGSGTDLHTWPRCPRIPLCTCSNTSPLRSHTLHCHHTCSHFLLHTHPHPRTGGRVSHWTGILTYTRKCRSHRLGCSWICQSCRS